MSKSDFRSFCSANAENHLPIYDAENKRNKTHSFFGNSEALLTVDDVAAQLQIKKKTLYQWSYKGLIPFVKVGRLLRFRASEIERWLQTQKE